MFKNIYIDLGHEQKAFSMLRGPTTIRPLRITPTSLKRKKLLKTSKVAYQKNRNFRCVNFAFFTRHLEA
jgi:hypothetical protein